MLVRAIRPSLGSPNGGPSSPGVGASRRSPLPRLSSAERPAFVGHARRFSRACKTITIPKKDKPDSRPAAPRAASFKTSVNHHMNGESLSPYKQPPQLER